MTYQFPESFLYGAASSSHQVEGHNTNDWTGWEQRNAKRLAVQASKNRHLPPEASKPATYISGRAMDHYCRYEEDLDLAKEIGLNCYRFSIEWSRVYPENSKSHNSEAIAHYRRMTEACIARGLEPFVTIWHFTLPVWAMQLGGWESSEVVKAYIEFTELLILEFGDLIKFWATFNEPDVYTSLVYLPHPLVSRGFKWLDYPSGFFHFRKARRNIVKAHRLAYRRIKELKPELQVGITLDLIYYESRNDPLSLLYKWLRRRTTNHYFANKTARYCDWLGLQYYYRHQINLWKINTYGLFPQGHRPMLNQLAKYGKPIYITESGLDDHFEKDRAEYIKTSLRSIAEAINEDGIDCRGYIHWSLMDGFEWAGGFWPRFGLIDVDHDDPELKRTIRKSAQSYTEIIKRRSI